MTESVKWMMRFHEKFGKVIRSTKNWHTQFKVRFAIFLEFIKHQCAVHFVRVIFYYPFIDKSTWVHSELNWPLVSSETQKASCILGFIFDIKKLHRNIKNWLRPIYRYLIFEITSSQNWVLNLIFCLFWTGFLQ